MLMVSSSTICTNTWPKNLTDGKRQVLGKWFFIHFKYSFPIIKRIQLKWVFLLLVFYPRSDYKIIFLHFGCSPKSSAHQAPTWSLKVIWARPLHNQMELYTVFLAEWKLQWYYVSSLKVCLILLFLLKTDRCCSFAIITPVSVWKKWKQTKKNMCNWG